MIGRRVVLLVLAVALSAIVAGCAGEEEAKEQSNVPAATPTPTPTPTPSPKPETTVDLYVVYYNDVATELIYDLLSTSAKQKYTKDDVHNYIYAFTKNGIYIYDYSIINKDVSVSKAQLDVEITWLVGGGYHKTKKHTVSLTLEDGEWKLDDLVLFNQ